MEGKGLQGQGSCGRLTVKDGWVTCPVCGRNIHLLKIRPHTQAKNLQVFCRTCRSEIVMNIEKGQCVKRQCQWLPCDGSCWCRRFCFARR